ncbi:hypothetical protein HY030_00880 [Candidatus Gottesmanbacteria bacterium]|nr:hypothetical protein [Candidatus Gottesmanbacteria bacterium]
MTPSIEFREGRKKTKVKIKGNIQTFSGSLVRQITVSNAEAAEELRKHTGEIFVCVASDKDGLVNNMANNVIKDSPTFPMWLGQVTVAQG